MSRIHVIACGVLGIDLKHLAQRLGLPVALRFLPGGLHATPGELRERVQEAIDEVSATGGLARIVLGYGVCGRGTVGLHARDVPLVIPRVHDCIALFLGSDAQYRAQFARHPGTYYISAGWVEEKGAGSTGRKMGSDGDVECDDAGFRRLLQEYGAENAQYIRDFLDSWKRNYTRAVFIDSGVGEQKERYADIATAMARECGWAYERLAGSHDLLAKALTADATTDEILVVPPGAVTEYDAVRRRLNAVAVAAAGGTAPRVETPPVAPGPEAPRAGWESGIGLGIDAGGTYTDAVLYDFGRNRILAKRKALTTPWDYTLGITEALGRLDAAELARAQLVAVSTTLATNAIVEGRGQKTGLLVMPPYGWRDVTGFTHAPFALIDGQLEIDGTELQPVDPAQVRAVARHMVDRQEVAAFAVGGYASHANPSHELEVKAAIEAETGLSVTCSHELSEGLHYRVRAETAALNARIIPCLRGLLDRLTPALLAHGVRAPVMIVRSDGSLMSLAAALERPLETMLSGPAASAAGASWLARRRDALVVDVGGTTTDTALIRNGVVDLCDEGATVGGWQTHVRALKLRTLGLGGDSHIRLEQGRFHMGPERVGPVAWLAATVRGADEALAWLESRLASGPLNGNDMVVLALVGQPDGLALDAEERQLLALLQERPRSVYELAEAVDKLHHSLLPLRRLCEHHLVVRCGFTPTDVLHAAGTVCLWDRAAAARVCRMHARLTGRTEADLVPDLIRQFERRLAAELLKKQMADEIDPDRIDAQPAALALFERALHGRADGYRVRVELQHPVVGVGAPAGCFVPGAARLLNAEAVVPEHADVANAVGAITGSVSFRRRVTVAVNERGLYRLGGVPGAPAFERIEDATHYGADYLRRMLRELAQKAGAAHPKIRIITDDSAAPSSEGQVIYGRTIEGWVSGRPGAPTVAVPSP